MMRSIDMQLAQRRATDHVANDVTNNEVGEYLVQEYYGLIHHLALSMLHDADAADDVAQQTMIRALKKIDLYEPDTNLRAWIYTIGLNICRGHLRKQKVRTRLHATLTAIGLQQPIPLSPEQILLQDERDQALWDAVNQLKETHRIPIILRYSHGITTAEIATILNLPHGTVRSRLHHAHRKLHETLSTDELTRMGDSHE